MGSILTRGQINFEIHVNVIAYFIPVPLKIIVLAHDGLFLSRYLMIVLQYKKPLANFSVQIGGFSKFVNESYCFPEMVSCLKKLGLGRFRYFNI